MMTMLIKNRPVAQLAERRSPKPKVGGSIPFWPVFRVYELLNIKKPASR